MLKLKGMPGFTLLWLGHTLSLLGGSMALFSITFWIYQRTGQATPVAMLSFFNIAPMVVFGLFTGVLVDRYDRRLMMVLADCASLVVNLLLMSFAGSGSLEIWHLYAAAFINGSFQTFQWPAISASITLMVDKKHYGRAASMLDMATMSSSILAPMLAGSLLGFVGLASVLAASVLGSGLAVVSMLFVYFPVQPSRMESTKPLLIKEIRESFTYLLARLPLVGVQSIFLASNFFMALSFSLLGPFVLAKTGNNSLAFASVETAGAIGGLVGAGIMALIGGLRNRILGITSGWVGCGIAGLCVIGVGEVLTTWMVGSFLGSFLGCLISSSNQALWQSKVSPELQGRVFALRRLIGVCVYPLASLVAGPLADNVLEPAMNRKGALESAFGSLVGVGQGSGIGLIFIGSGLAISIVNIVAFCIPLIRNAESLIPDHDESLSERSAFI